MSEIFLNPGDYIQFLLVYLKFISFNSFNYNYLAQKHYKTTKENVYRKYKAKTKENKPEQNKTRMTN